jgi:uncharacterized hydrophobic protein (TIGR00271 family)
MHDVGRGIAAWLRLALVPVSILLLVVGVWLLPVLAGLGGVAAALLGVAWLALLVAVLRTVSRDRLAADERDTIAAELFVEPARRIAWLTRFVTLLTLATVIATLGLIADSTAVVIGAMVVAPLMSPLMSLAYALTMTRPVRAAEYAGVVVAGSALTAACAAALSWVVPGTERTAELLARTSPQLTDLGIALAAGAAGGYVTVRRSELGALPGVAIAVALVPPLSTVGVMLELGEPERAEQALVLFATNAVAIVLAAAIVFVVTGLTASAGEIRRARRLRVGLGVTTVATVAVMVPLAHNSVARFERASEETDLREALGRALLPSGSFVDDIEILTPGDAGDRTVVVVDASGARPPEADTLAEIAAAELETAVSLRLRWELGATAVAAAP